MDTPRHAAKVVRAAEDHPRVPSVARQQVDGSHDEEMVRPPGPEQREMRFEERQIRSKEEKAQEEDVVEGHVHSRRFAYWP